MKLNYNIPLFLLLTFVLYTKQSKGQVQKEWYFFNGQNSASIYNYNVKYSNAIFSVDSLLFGYIRVGGFYVYKATHRQGLIKKTKFNYVNYLEPLDMCIDTLNKHIYVLGRTGSRPPLNKFSHGIVYKLDYDLNAIDSTLITYGTLYDPFQIALHNNKLYIAGSNSNYFSQPAKINIAILNLNLVQLNLKVVSDSSCSRIPLKMLFKNNKDLVIYTSRTSTVCNYNKIIVDTNLNILSNSCVLNNCNYGVPVNIVKDANGYTYSFDDYVYKTNFQPYTYIKDYHIRVNENEDTINSTYFFKGINSTNYYISRYKISNLQKIKNNQYLGLGAEYTNDAAQTKNKFFVLDSTLKIINQFDVFKYTNAQIHLSDTKIGKTTNGTYYIASTVNDTVNTSTYDAFCLITIDSTAKLPPITPTTITNPTETIWDNITVYPNPTNDVVNIAVPPNSNYNINVYNTLGQQLISFNDVSSTRQISLANLPTGVYHFVFYETNLKKSITKKVILQK